MEYNIQTVYQREDIEGFYEAFLAGKKPVRAAKKVSKVIATILAVLFWACAAFMLIAQICIGDITAVLSGLPLTFIMAALGLLMFTSGRKPFKSKASWKAYPNKGEQLSYCFREHDFILTQANSETKTSYSGIVRLFEDKRRFYLFNSPQTAHILPKRDFAPSYVDEFRDFITAVTGLVMEHS